MIYPETLTQIDAQSQVKGGMTVRALATVLLVRQSGPLRTRDIAQRLSIPKSAVSRLSSTLIQKGMLKRATDRQDSRVVWISITPKGQQLAELVQ